MTQPTPTNGLDYMNAKQVMHRIFWSLLLVVLATLSSASRADVSLRWQTTESSLSPLLASYLAKSKVISDFVMMVDENFTFDQPLVLELGASAGPDYEPVSNTIRMPYGFLERAVFTQSLVSDVADEGNGENTNAVSRAIDVVEYTLYHLLGHSLVSDADEGADDTVEALSTYIMVEYWPNGAEQWAANVEAFGAASQKLDGPLSDYWHAHSLYKERQRTIQCWIEGSVIQEECTLKSTTQTACENYQRCRASWNNLVKAAQPLLEPYLLPDSTLRRPLGVR